MVFLELSRVCKSFTNGARRIPVLRDVDLRVERGEFIAILGPSGAGKTTLISLIAGLIRPDSGAVILGEREVVEPDRDCGVVFQNYSLLPWLTAQENVELAVAQQFPDLSRAQRRARAADYLSLVNLSGAGRKRPAELSGGMRQRVALARALAPDPELLLLDEPLGALDALNRSTLQDEIANLWQRQRKTVVLITNDVDEAILLADRVLPLRAAAEPGLAPAIPIDLPRPRLRQGLNRTPRFQALRAEIVHALLKCQPRRALPPGGETRPPAASAPAGNPTWPPERKSALAEAVL